MPQAKAKTTPAQRLRASELRLTKEALRESQEETASLRERYAHVEGQLAERERQDELAKFPERLRLLADSVSELSYRVRHFHAINTDQRAYDVACELARARKLLLQRADEIETARQDLIALITPTSTEPTSTNERSD